MHMYVIQFLHDSVKVGNLIPQVENLVHDNFTKNYQNNGHSVLK